MDVAKVGQIYCSLRGGVGAWIRIEEVGPASVRAVDAETGDPLPKRIPIRDLHHDPCTRTGRARTAGWLIEMNTARLAYLRSIHKHTDEE